MRVVVVSPLPSQDNSLTEAVRTELRREAISNGFEFSEEATQNVSEDSITVIYDRIINSLMRDAWISLQLPAQLKKIKPDIVVQLTGISLRSDAFKQIQLISPGFYDKEKCVRKWERVAFAKRDKIFDERNFFAAASDTITTKLKTELELPLEHIPSFSFQDDSTLATWEKTEEIKKHLTGGAEFFFSDIRFASEAEVVTLLKAFSFFKKWQQSAMHLILFAKTSDAYASLLSNYKYRNDITVTDNDDALPAAYVLVQPFADVSVRTISKAANSSVTVITRASDLLSSNQNAVFSTVNLIPDEIGQAMLSLYKNEERRNNYAQAALKDYTEKRSEQNLLEIIRARQ